MDMYVLLNESVNMDVLIEMYRGFIIFNGLDDSKNI